MIAFQKIKRIALGLIFIPLLFSFVPKERYMLEYSYISAEQGLDTDECNFSYQDQEGYIWIGTNEGLFRYDGYDILSFDNIIHDNSLSQIKFFDAVEGEDNKVWFATSAGMLSFDKVNNKAEFLIQPQGAGYSLKQGLASLSRDKSGKIWFGGVAGVFSYDPASQQFQRFLGEYNGKTVRPNVRDLVIDAEGNIWVATWGQGLGLVDQQAGVYKVMKFFDRGPNPSKYNTLFALHIDKKNNLWVGTWDDGLYVLDINDAREPIILDWFGREEKTTNSLIGNIIYDINEDKNGAIWIGTPYGVSVLQNWGSANKSFNNYSSAPKKNSLNNNEVRGVFRDHTGIMWLATQGGGINKIKIIDQNYTTYLITPVDSLKKSQSINSFTMDPQNRLLVGVQSLGFGVYDLKRQVFHHFTNFPEYKPLEELNINTVKSFIWDRKGVMWLGTRYRGLIKYDPKTKDYYSISNDFDHDAYSLRTIEKLSLDTNNNLWLISEGNLYHIVQGDGSKFDDFAVHNIAITQMDEDAPRSRPIDFDIDERGILYLGMSNGEILKSSLSIYEEGELTFTKISMYGHNNMVHSIYTTGDQLWVGGENGIQRYQIGESDRYIGSYLSEIRNLKISSMVRDRNRLLALSNRGVVALDIGEEEEGLNILSSDEGLQGNVFIKGALYKNDNRIFVGGHNGFNVLNTRNLVFDHSEPKVNLISIGSEDREIYNVDQFTEDKPFVVKYNDNAITISFAALDLRNPDDLYYAYKMDGLDDEWNYVSSNNRTATYVNLKPGDYSFMVKSTNARGKWALQHTTLPIYVQTAPYLTWWAYLIYSIILLGILYVIFVMYRRQARAKEDLRIQSVERSKSEKLNQFKLQFFTNLSHELLTPLSVLMIIAQKWRFSASKESEKEVRILNSNVNKLHEHIKQMLHFRKAETGNMILNLQDFSFNHLLEEILENYQVVAADKGVRLDYAVQENISGKMDREKLEMCLNNLLSNAIKYTPKGGLVNLEAIQQEAGGARSLYIKVTDTGRGIPKEHLDKIFNRFYRLSAINHFEDGLGIGLALTQHLIALQGGQIMVDSVEGEGTSFELTIPLSTTDNSLIPSTQISFPEEEEIESIERRSRKQLNPFTDIKYSGKKLLLVEDNPDFLVLMETYLSLYYKVITAQTGTEALELANNNDIDLIVSDLMVPEMDGFELCKKIKSDVNTSHIPFVIVTARTEDQDRLIGYEAGADSYLTKPINFEVLIYRLEALLKSREKVHADFNTGAFLEPKKIVNSSIDEEFLMKAKEIVENNISETEFSVKLLCEDLGMSNSMFYRKIKGILDITPNEFIKNIRLRRAAQLLEEKEINISEVAYMTGFNDLSYFGVCFKKQYGKSPSTFQKEFLGAEESNSLN